MKKFTIFVLVAVLVVGTVFGVAAQKKKVVVGNKNFTEQYIIGQLMKQMLEEHGFTVNLKSDLSSMVMRKGLETGDIDICAEYTGTAWMSHLGYPYSPSIGHQALYAAVKAIDETDNKLVWLDPIWNHNTYALAVWPEYAEEHDLETMSDLAALYREEDGKINTFIDFEYSQRPDGLPALEEYYDFKIAKNSLKTGAPGASVTALDNKQTTVGMVFATDSKIAENDWVVLQDNKMFYPPYDLTPIVNQGVLKQYPEIEDILNELVASFPGGGEDWTPQLMVESQKEWSALNGMVDIDRMDADEAAEDYLKEHGLID
ncbi:MAG: glycine betaine ABC transporter substrate-binding protein [Candidatus Acetothermia bacterium]